MNVFADLVSSELERAYAVILEELDEFKAEVWKKRSERNNRDMLNELVQVAAMAQRAAEDLGLLNDVTVIQPAPARHVGG